MLSALTLNPNSRVGQFTATPDASIPDGALFHVPIYSARSSRSSEKFCHRCHPQHRNKKEKKKQKPEENLTMAKVSEPFANLAGKLKQKPNDCLDSLLAFRQFHGSIPSAAVAILVTAICAAVPDCRDDIVLAVATLIIALTGHPDFNGEHARAVTKCATAVLFKAAHRPANAPGDIAPYVEYGEILACTLHMCEYPPIYVRVLLSIADKIACIRSSPDRLVGIKIMQGLAHSPAADVYGEEWLLPRFKVILPWEDVNLGDAVFACACAIKSWDQRFKMRMLWDKVCLLWDDSVLDDDRKDKRMAVVSLCEMFRGDAHLYPLFNEGEDLGELLADICTYTIEECARFESGGGNGDATFLRCVADGMPTLVRLMMASGKAEIRRAALAMFEALRQSTDGPVSRACALRYAALHPLLYVEEGNAKEEVETVPSLPKSKLKKLANRVTSCFKKLFCLRGKGC